MLTLKSYAKLNLYLQVLNLRPDGYHNIRTVFERIDLCDKLVLKPRQDKRIKIICSHPLVPKNNANLCYRAAKALRDYCRVKQGIEIKIIKRIPVGAGLGGGSSNAAAVLSGLNKIWRLGLSRKNLAGLGRKIGADVPFFLYNTPFAIGEGIGDRIKPLPRQRFRRFWHIIVVPKVHVPTVLIYKKWDNRQNLGLTKPSGDVKMLLSALKQGNLSLIERRLFNSLEAVTSKLYPAVARVKDKLKRLGAKSILMSGSGPAVFGILSCRKEAVSLSRKLAGEDRFWRIFVTKTF